MKSEEWFRGTRESWCKWECHFPDCFFCFFPEGSPDHHVKEFNAMRRWHISGESENEKNEGGKVMKCKGKQLRTSVLN
ncbi:unnamed protein product [Orchesella dallaii]|uniref:Uncharacterized protein n=1 Tax=Orchesella dallaii TaxID=48710 RepID=A0ABP1S5F9_9HEXA